MVKNTPQLRESRVKQLDWTDVKFLTLADVEKNIGCALQGRLTAKQKAQAFEDAKMRSIFNVGEKPQGGGVGCERETRSSRRKRSGAAPKRKLADNRFDCAVCEWKNPGRLAATRQKRLQDHQQEVHGQKSSGKLFRCENTGCNKTYSNQNGLNGHGAHCPHKMETLHAASADPPTRTLVNQMKTKLEQSLGQSLGRSVEKSVKKSVEQSVERNLKKKIEQIKSNVNLSPAFGEQLAEMDKKITESTKCNEEVLQRVEKKLETAASALQTTNSN